MKFGIRSSEALPNNQARLGLGKQGRATDDTAGGVGGGHHRIRPISYRQEASSGRVAESHSFPGRLSHIRALLGSKSQSRKFFLVTEINPMPDVCD